MISKAGELHEIACWTRRTNPIRNQSARIRNTQKYKRTYMYKKKTFRTRIPKKKKCVGGKKLAKKIAYWQAKPDNSLGGKADPASLCFLSVEKRSWPLRDKKVTTAAAAGLDYARTLYFFFLSSPLEFFALISVFSFALCKQLFFSLSLSDFAIFRQTSKRWEDHFAKKKLQLNANTYFFIFSFI